MEEQLLSDKNNNLAILKKPQETLKILLEQVSYYCKCFKPSKPEEGTTEELSQKEYQEHTDYEIAILSAIASRYCPTQFLPGIIFNIIDIEDNTKIENERLHGPVRKSSVIFIEKSIDEFIENISDYVDVMKMSIVLTEKEKLILDKTLENDIIVLRKIQSRYKQWTLL